MTGRPVEIYDDKKGEYVEDKRAWSQSRRTRSTREERIRDFFVTVGAVTTIFFLGGIVVMVVQEIGRLFG